MLIRPPASYAGGLLRFLMILRAGSYLSRLISTIVTQFQISECRSHLLVIKNSGKIYSFVYNFSVLR